MNIPSKICLMCGTIFYKRNNCSKQKWNNTKYCSIICKYQSKRNKPQDVWKKIDIKSGDDWWRCWEWLGSKYKDGYGRIKINQLSYLAHRLVYEQIYGNIPIGLYVCHTCNNPSCCNPNHLYGGTSKDNMNQKVREGRQAKGKQCFSNVKLTDEEVLKIRRLYSIKEYTQRKLGEIFGVCQAEISMIVNNKKWKYLLG